MIDFIIPIATVVFIIAVIVFGVIKVKKDNKEFDEMIRRTNEKNENEFQEALNRSQRRIEGGYQPKGSIDDIQIPEGGTAVFDPNKAKKEEYQKKINFKSFGRKVGRKNEEEHHPVE